MLQFGVFASEAVRKDWEQVEHKNLIARGFVVFQHFKHHDAQEFLVFKSSLENEIFFTFEAPRRIFGKKHSVISTERSNHILFVEKNTLVSKIVEELEELIVLDICELDGL